MLSLHKGSLTATIWVLTRSALGALGLGLIIITLRPSRLRGCVFVVEGLGDVGFGVSSYAVSGFRVQCPRFDDYRFRASGLGFRVSREFGFRVSN